MRAIVVREHGGPDRLRLEERPVPEPGPGEIRLRLAAAGVNHLDLWVRRGVPGHPFPLPIVPGADGAGVVDALGAGVGGPEVGTRVLVAPGFVPRPDEWTARGMDQLSPAYGIFGETRDGTYAECVVAPSENVLPIPDAMTFELAAAFPLAMLTAWGMLVRRAALVPGETVLVHAAGSGVSTAAMSIARLMGAGRVIATTSSPAKAAKARGTLADEVVLTTAPDWSREVRRLTGNRGVDVVVDHVGPTLLEGSLRCLAKGGRYVTCGSTSGPQATVNLNLVFFKSISILGSTMGSLGEVHRCLRLVSQGRLAPVIDSVLPLEQAAEAHRRLEAREAFGKVVLRIADL